MKTSFDLDDYKGEYVMHCQTEDEADSFLKVLHDAGRKWRSGESYAKLKHYGAYGHHTVYYFNNGTFCQEDVAISDGYTILEWSDFIEDDDENEISDEEFHDMLSNLLCI